VKLVLDALAEAQGVSTASPQDLRAFCVRTIFSAPLRQVLRASARGGPKQLAPGKEKGPEDFSPGPVSLGFEEAAYMPDPGP
jgi:hypothetical protein